uniref:DUF2075 domain-containing protein n=1 Tax=Pedobacter schmidteae TaxID=2201271 RepID=UPI000EB246CE|nr:DUF2075 domain-containing protein [Pedobacter schmidteae]
MKSFSIKDIKIFKVDPNGYTKDQDIDQKYRLWPLVYILYKRKVLYVGETTDIKKRFKYHSKNELKAELGNKIVMFSDYFNKSATLQLEAKLIEFLSADGRFKLLNLNLGLSKHNYYHKEHYEKIFPEIWNSLKEKHIVKNTLKDIINLNSFKYSPYKFLNGDQQAAIIAILEALNQGKKTIFVKGGAGTGKTVLAMYLMKLLATPMSDFDIEEFDDTFSIEAAALTRKLQGAYNNPESDIGLVVPMASLRGTLTKVFRNIENLSDDMVITPAKAALGAYKLLIVDEAHRLRRRKALGQYGILDKPNAALKLPRDTHELTWMLKKSASRILFYDKRQSIRPSDVEQREFDELLSKDDTLLIELKSQIRSKGGDLYSDFVERLMHSALKPKETFESDEYELLLMDDVGDLRNKIIEKDQQFGLSRVVAGFAWEWKSQHDKSLYDISIGGHLLRWNTTTSDWINSPDAINEVGCIHTTMGCDLNYAGIIFGDEIGYDIEKKEFIFRPKAYKDRNGKSGVNATDIEEYITNIYETLLLRAVNGTYIYCCDEGLKAYFTQHIKVSGI